jgi:hypothetical protein
MDIALFQTFVRYALLAAFGFLASRGYYDKSLIEPLVGAGLALFAIIWYVIAKYLPEKKSHVDNDT